MKYYVLKHANGKYFQMQNLYLGTAETTKNLGGAKFMSLKEATSAFGCMNEKNDWAIVRVVKDWIEGEVVKTGFDMLREKKELLQKQLEDVQKQMQL